MNIIVNLIGLLKVIGIQNFFITSFCSDLFIIIYVYPKLGDNEVSWV